MDFVEFLPKPVIENVMKSLSFCIYSLIFIYGKSDHDLHDIALTYSTIIRRLKIILALEIIAIKNAQ